MRQGQESGRIDQREPDRQDAHRRSIEARLQSTGRVGEDQGDQGDRCGFTEEDRDFCKPADVGDPDIADEPQQPDERHEATGPVRRLTCPEGEAPVEIRPSDGQVEEDLVGRHTRAVVQELAQQAPDEPDDPDDRPKGGWSHAETVAHRCRHSAESGRQCGLALMERPYLYGRIGTMDTILIVDDHAPFRVLARRLLEADGFTVVGEAETGASGIEAARTLRPHLILLDIGLPDVEGFDVASALAADGQPPFVVLTSSRDADAYGPRLDGSQALGFIPKDELSGASIRAFAAKA